MTLHNYTIIKRDDWKQLKGQSTFTVSNEQLKEITSLNDRLSMKDVEDIYLPLVQLFSIYFENHYQKQQLRQQFLKQNEKAIPFIIGISGSVSVGKSTSARLLQILLKQAYPQLNVSLVTTDGFLYTNSELEKRGLLDRKGFPESYDMAKLVDFLLAIKMNQSTVAMPVYSHKIYDIVPNETVEIIPPDILIVEGINVLQLPANQDIYVSDFFDWALYVDAQPELIEQWFLERFEMLVTLSKDDPDNFYYQFAHGDKNEGIQLAKKVWKEINLKNLEEYILPTRTRADVVIHKTFNHAIDYIGLRNY